MFLVPVVSTGLCHFLFGGQVSRKTYEQRKETPVAPTEIMGMPPRIEDKQRCYFWNRLNKLEPNNNSLIVR